MTNIEKCKKAIELVHKLDLPGCIPSGLISWERDYSETHNEFKVKLRVRELWAEDRYYQLALWYNNYKDEVILETLWGIPGHLDCETVLAHVNLELDYVTNVPLVVNAYRKVILEACQNLVPYKET